MATNGKAEHVLIVEDEMLIAMHLEDLLGDLGHEVAGICSRLDDAIAFIDDHAIDLAVLDVNLGGPKSFPVAKMLRERGVPFFFLTGYGIEGVDAAYRNEIILQKPVNPAQLSNTIGVVLSR